MQHDAKKYVRMPNSLCFEVSGRLVQWAWLSFDFKPEGSSDGGTAARHSKHTQAGPQLGNEERQQEETNNRAS